MDCWSSFVDLDGLLENFVVFTLRSSNIDWQLKLMIVFSISKSSSSSILRVYAIAIDIGAQVFQSDFLSLSLSGLGVNHHGVALRHLLLSMQICCLSSCWLTFKLSVVQNESYVAEESAVSNEPWPNCYPWGNHDVQRENEIRQDKILWYLLRCISRFQCSINSRWRTTLTLTLTSIGIGISLSAKCYCYRHQWAIHLHSDQGAIYYDSYRI